MIGMTKIVEIKYTRINKDGSKGISSTPTWIIKVFSVKSGG
jgi:hypothetical protein